MGSQLGSWQRFQCEQSHGGETPCAVGGKLRRTPCCWSINWGALRLQREAGLRVSATGSVLRGMESLGWSPVKGEGWPDLPSTQQPSSSGSRPRTSKPVSRPLPLSRGEMGESLN